MTREEGSETICRRHLRVRPLGDVDDEGDKEAQSDHPWLDKIDAQLQWRNANGDLLFTDHINLRIWFEKRYYCNFAQDSACELHPNLGYYADVSLLSRWKE